MKKKIPVAVVSNKIVVAEESEKMIFSNPDDGAPMVKFLEVAVPDEKYDIPCAAKTAPEELINSTALFMMFCKTPDESIITAP